MSGIGQTIVQGMAFGTGSAIAHRAVGAAAGAMSGGGSADAPVSEPTEANASAAGASSDGPSCNVEIGKFYECLDSHDGNIGDCQLFFDMMQQCQKDAQLRSAYN